VKRLRWQLIATLVFVALLPALPAALTVKALVGRSLEAPLEDAILEGARSGLAAVREQLDERKRAFLDEVASGGPLETLTDRRWAALTQDERDQLTRRSEEAHEPRRLGRALLITGPERMSIDGRDHLAARIETPDLGPHWVVSRLPDELVERARRIAESVRLLESLRREEDRLSGGLLAAFLVVYGLTLFVAVPLGLALASRLTRPLEVLGVGIDRVAAGDLETRVPAAGGREMRRLLSHFNEMAARLARQREDLLRLEKVSTWRDMSRRLAHEIKNPLTPIQLAAQEIRDAYGGGDETYGRLLREGTDIIEEEVRSLRELVRSFSELGRLPEPDLRVVRASEIRDEIQALYGSRIEATGDRWEDLRLRCDPSQIHRLLINLVNNARAAQEETGTDEPVEIHLASGGPQRLCLSVLDRGPGVPEGDRGRIFEPDFTGRSEGMGLGLAIVETIAKAHGGHIDVGDRPGGGAVFTLTLNGGISEDP
jgi:nitrogen fixation/metabolism regulation signal transduction histidine kinase